jgi:hypothetical protein
MKRLLMQAFLFVRASFQDAAMVCRIPAKKGFKEEIAMRFSCLCGCFLAAIIAALKPMKNIRKS